MNSTKNLGFLTGIILLLAACNPSGPEVGNITLENAKIVSLNGTVTEILVEMGLEDQIVGVDVASTYPASIVTKPKVGHNRNVAPEGVLSLAPTHILGTTADLTDETLAQLQQSGVKIMLFEHNYNLGGSKILIKTIADSLNMSEKGDEIIRNLDNELEDVRSFQDHAEKTKVLFIYARGAGTMMVGGSGTQVDEMIRLAGGVNVASDITEYKPLTAEALIAYDPEVILLFDSGLSSLGDVEGILELPGVKDTEAGKNRKIVHMDGQFLTGFSPRVAKAIQDLHDKISD